MIQQHDIGKLNKKFEGKTLADFSGDIPAQRTIRKIKHAELRTITDQWQKGDITYSRMVEVINEHFGFNNNTIDKL